MITGVSCRNRKAEKYSMGLDAVQESALIPFENGILEKSGSGFHFPEPFVRQYLFYVLWEDEYLCDASYSVERQYVDCLQFLYVTEGCLELQYRDFHTRLKEGDLAYMDLRYPHSYRAAGERLRLQQIMINGNAAREYFELLYRQHGPVYHAGSAVRYQILSLRQEMMKGETDDHAVSCMIHNILSSLAADRNRQISETTAHARTYMSEHYAEQISLEDIARELSLNKSYFSRHFRKETGYSPWEYLTRVRMQAAFRLLSASSDSVEVIAEACGFASASHFIRTFKKETGMTPNYFRRQFSR